MKGWSLFDKDRAQGAHAKGKIRRGPPWFSNTVVLSPKNYIHLLSSTVQ